MEGDLITKHVGGKGIFSTPAMIGLMEAASHKSLHGLLPEGQTTVGYEVHVRHVAPAAARLRHAQAGHRPRRFLMSDELERVSPRENAHAKARDRKVRGPKVIAVNPGLKKLAEHIATKARKPTR